MQEGYIRTWKKVDIEKVKKHLLLVDSGYGICNSCKKLGIKPLEEDSCPQCKTPFLYIALPKGDMAQIKRLLEKIEKKRSPILIIDKEDFQKIEAKKTLHDLF